MQEGVIRETALGERRGVRETARRTGVHSARDVAATHVTAAEASAVASAKTCVPSEAAAMSAAGVTAAVLCP